MPELPEVEIVRRGLAPHLTGRRLAATSHSGAPLRFPLPDFSPLYGRRLLAVDRRSKYLLFRFEGGLTLVWHLGMTGQFHALAMVAPPGPFEHARLDFDGGVSLRYRDVRRFGYAGLLRENKLMAHPWFASLGPEPLETSFDADWLRQVCSGRRVPIKSLLMDARCVVGVGNIYASESLFRAGIHPARAAGRISAVRLAALVAAVKEVLAEAIEAGGSSIRDFVHADGKPGYFAHHFAVYGREGRPCPNCGEPVRRLVQAGRSSFYCPSCQH